MASVHFIESLTASDSKFRPKEKNFEFISRSRKSNKNNDTHPNTSNGWHFWVCIRVCVVHHFRSIYLSSLFSWWEHKMVYIRYGTFPLVAAFCSCSAAPTLLPTACRSWMFNFQIWLPHNYMTRSFSLSAIQPIHVRQCEHVGRFVRFPIDFSIVDRKRSAMKMISFSPFGHFHARPADLFEWNRKTLNIITVTLIEWMPIFIDLYFECRQSYDYFINFFECTLF